MRSPSDTKAFTTDIAVREWEIDVVADQPVVAITGEGGEALTLRFQAEQLSEMAASLLRLADYVRGGLPCGMVR